MLTGVDIAMTPPWCLAKLEAGIPPPPKVPQNAVPGVSGRTDPMSELSCVLSSTLHFKNNT